MFSSLTEEQKATHTAVLDRKIQESHKIEKSLVEAMDCVLAKATLQQPQRKEDKRQAARDKKVITTTTRMC